MPHERSPRRPCAKVRGLVGHAGWLARWLGAWFPGEEERRLNEGLVGYPSNHVYRLCRRRAVPSFQLHQRLATVEAAYPENLESFLDLGCCRGYFVLDAARRSSCRVAVGVDVHEPFVSIAARVGRYLDLPRATFHVADLNAVSANPPAFGGPFQVVLTLGTYHYLYWGSHRYPEAYHNHREILARLSCVCTERLVFSARLEVGRLPLALRSQAAASDKASDYTQERFLDAAAEFFDIEPAGRVGRNPLLLMWKRGPAAH